MQPYVLGWGLEDPPRGDPRPPPRISGRGRGGESILAAGEGRGQSLYSPAGTGRGGDRICSPRRGRGGAGTELQKIFGDEDGLAIPESPRKCHVI